MSSILHYPPDSAQHLMDKLHTWTAGSLVIFSTKTKTRKKKLWKTTFFLRYVHISCLRAALHHHKEMIVIPSTNFVI